MPCRGRAEACIIRTVFGLHTGFIYSFRVTYGIYPYGFRVTYGILTPVSLIARLGLKGVHTVVGDKGYRNPRHLGVNEKNRGFVILK